MLCSLRLSSHFRRHTASSAVQAICCRRSLDSRGQPQRLIVSCTAGSDGSAIAAEHQAKGARIRYTSVPREMRPAGSQQQGTAMRKRTIDSYFTKSPKKLATAVEQPHHDPSSHLVANALSASTAADTSAAQAAALSTTDVQQRAVTSSLNAAAGAPAAAADQPALPVAGTEPPSAPARATDAAPDAPAVTAPIKVLQPPSGFLLNLLHEPTWKTALNSEFHKPYFKTLDKFVADELAPGKPPVYPPQEHIFRAFNTCPFDQVKVVILGQDPYHGPGQAMGLSFSVPPGIRTPSSLQNIYKEIKADLGHPVPNHGNLEHWAGQGVLLLNAVLTVRGGAAASHSKKGWEQLTDAAIKALASKRSGIVFLLWGQFAISKAKLIPEGRHKVLTAVHPSGLSAHKGFFGCKHFSKANAYLAEHGQQPINWCIRGL